RPPRRALASAPGALRRGAAGAAAVLPRRRLCAAEMAQGRDADRPPIPDDAVDRRVARRGARGVVIAARVRSTSLPTLPLKGGKAQRMIPPSPLRGRVGVGGPR